MELGGNKLAKAYYEKNGMLPVRQTPDHKNPALTRYKNELKSKAEKSLGMEASNPVPVQITTVEPSKDKSEFDFVPQKHIPKSNIIIMGQSKPDEEKKDANQGVEPVAAAKKPRAIVANETDIFDFSDLKKQTETKNLVIEKKSPTIKPSATATPVILKKSENEQDFLLGSFF